MTTTRFVLFLLAGGGAIAFNLSTAALAQYQSYNAQYQCIVQNPSGTVSRAENYMLLSQLRYPQHTDSIARRLGNPYCQLPNTPNGFRQYLYIWDWDWAGNGTVLRVSGDRVIAADYWLGAANQPPSQREVAIRQIRQLPQQIQQIPQENWGDRIERWLQGGN
jgi:hypothetical protein